MRANGRCPAKDFLDGCTRAMEKKFRGSFDALVKMGQKYVNSQRFKPLLGDGKPLWELKEHDHRLYCVRNCMKGEEVEVVLLDGWVKDKADKQALQEKREIGRSQNLYDEYRLGNKGNTR